jgi:hypothetical protein
MNVANAIALALALVELIERGVTLTEQMAKIVADAKTTLLAAQQGDSDVTDTQLAAIRGQIDAILADLNKD